MVIAVPDAGGFQAKLFGRKWFHLDVPRHLYHFDSASMRQLINAVGFEIKGQFHQEFEYDLMGWTQSALNTMLPVTAYNLLQVIELLAAVPSVIYGLLGVFIVIPLMREYIQPGLKNSLGFLPLFQGPAYGVGFLTAGIVLAIMVIPYIISVSREVLLSVPRDQREAALALGSTRWESTWKVVVPFARTGIMGSIFLALARALGETVAVAMVIGNTPIISASLFSPGYSIAAVIANEFTEATGDVHLQSLIELGLVLFLLTFILNGLARLLIVATSQRGGGMGQA